MFFKNRSFENNSKRLLDLCESLIDQYETHNEKPSCKSDMLTRLTAMIVAAKKEVSNWNNDEINYPKIAHSMLANVSFDLLASGKYHLYRGTLNPTSCSDNLMDVYRSSMKYGLDAGFFSEYDRNDQYSYLLELISSVG